MNDQIREIIDEDTLIIQIAGEEPKKYYKLVTFDADNGKSYMIYSDGEMDEVGNTKVLASIYDPRGIDLNLYPIESETEWNIINEILKSIEKDIIKARKGVVESEN